MEESSCVGNPSSDSGHEVAFGGQLAAIRDGCSSTLGEVLESCRGYLLWVANNEVPGDIRQKFAPSDVVQDTFLDAKIGIDRFEGRSPDTSNRKGMLWMITLLGSQLLPLIERSDRRETLHGVL